MALLQVENLSFTYPGQHANAVADVSFALEPGSFSLLIGASGCGKTTLLRLLKQELAPHGTRCGRILLDGAAVDTRAPNEIAYVAQNPDEQIVTDEVSRELAFGLENMGLPRDEIRLRVGETASYFGIGDWYHRPTDALSGGQKQLLNLAAALCMRPHLLLLDEPTGQLDPVAAARFIATLYRLNRELGLTILLAEHRLEDAFPLADGVLAMETGRLIASGAPRAVCAQMQYHPLFAGFPAAARIWSQTAAKGPCPLTVREGRALLDRQFAHCVGRVPEPPHDESAPPVLEASGVWFRYEKATPDVLRDFAVTVRRGEILSVLGGNGSGKTTMLNVLAGLDRPYRGKCRIFGKKISEYTRGALYRNTLALLPQNPATVFVQSTVADDLAELLAAQNVPKAARPARVAAQAEALGIAPLLDRHPYDLSGGEQQKCALAKLLLTEPRLILLDEPTKGLDAAAKQQLGALLRGLQQKGISMLTVTHDVEFAAAFSDRCALFFDGKLIASGTPNAFFSGNHFYTTAASRIARSHFPNAVRCCEVAALCKGGTP